MKKMKECAKSTENLVGWVKFLQAKGIAKDYDMAYPRGQGLVNNAKTAFTLSEVIITLVILGVVAAITVPMMSNSASDKKWNVARQKAKATIGEAFRLMTVNGEISTTNADGTPRTTEYMVTKILPKYLKLEKTCGSGSTAAGNCGFKMVNGTPKIKNISGTQINLPLQFSTSTNFYRVTSTVSFSSPMGTNASMSNNNTTTQNYNNSYFFRTLDGFSINFFYNPYCATDEKDKIVTHWGVTYTEQLSGDVICFNAVYDMNGKKGPNQVGKDIGFIGSFYNGYTVKTEAVLPYNKEFVASSLPRYGNSYAQRGINYCNNLKEKGDWILANKYELALLYINKNTAGLSTNGFHARDLFVLDRKYYLIDMQNDTSSGYGRIRTAALLTDTYRVLCVRANALK